MRDLVVIGGSAGGIEALRTLVAGLPPDLPAAVCVVIHIPEATPSTLAQSLGRLAALPAEAARHDGELRPGHVYVAPPGYHLLVRLGWMELSRGPRENGSRPAIDPLFRSAARAYGPRVVAVLLSGALGDGTTGSLAVHARGGVTIAQDPAEALFPDLPRRAIRDGQIDHIAPTGQLAALVARLVGEPLEETRGDSAMAIDHGQHPAVQRDLDAQAHDERPTNATVYTCPECGGTIWQVEDGGVLQFRCHVGHTYSPELLLVQRTEQLEAALWACVRMLTEKATMTRQLAERTRQAGKADIADRIDERAALDEAHGHLLREQLLEPNHGLLDQPISVIDLLDQGREGAGP